MMKIDGFNNISSVTNVSGGVGRVSAAKQSSGAASTVSVSKEAAWISSTQATASSLPPVRADVVSEIRSQLAAGTFEQSIDMDSMIDSIVADL
jgi:flagellar biosynthesis anti-sigma factor FlgM